jgi:hypothetical protein
MRFVPGIAILVLACGSIEDEGPPDPRRCEQLREHLVDLQVREVHVATGIDREAHRRAMTAALGRDFVTSCTTRLVASQIRCALDATDPVAAAACSGSR